MSVSKLINTWQAEPTIWENITSRKDIPARDARFEPLPKNMHPALAPALAQTGIISLYLHQRVVWEKINQGGHVVIATGTASGKTLGYNLPVLDRLLQSSKARALYLFPTKALAQDQLATLDRLIYPLKQDGYSHLIAAIYDGDTPSGQRSSIRKRAHILLSNPDMLHAGILPHHTSWAELFEGLEFVVLDEIHVYRGVFGSHVANVIRRLKRIAHFYGSAPQFLLTSATIANPTELAEKLIEEKVQIVDADESARGPRHFFLYNPPIIHRELGIRRSALQESVRLAQDCLTYNLQTILFARSRRSVELVLTYLRGQSIGASESLSEKNHSEKGESTIRGYRSGYLARHRREIEAGLRQGSVRAVVATNALELGMDIGGMGVAILVGYPGTIAATLQQFGRSGRGKDASIAVLVLSSDPLDQFLARHPDYFYAQSPEQALINPDNLLILLDHVRCAAFELPFTPGEHFGGMEAEQLVEMLEFLVQSGVLHNSNGRYFWMADQYPAEKVSLRSASATTVILKSFEEDNPVTIGQVDNASAHWMVHPGAVYLHEGRTYQVDNLDLENNLATLYPVQTDYYTEPRMTTDVQLINRLQSQTVTGADKSYGEIKVVSQLIGFKKIRWYTQEILGVDELQLPPSELVTVGYWLALSDATVNLLRELKLWTNDPNRYGPNWKMQSELARLRDNYRCQVCGAPEQGRAHDVHHKTPFRSFRDAQGAPVYEVANRLDNLVTLCHNCHRRAESVVRIRSGLAGLAYVLRHLAPLFLMCDPGDLGVHADPHLPIAEGQPGIVIYEHVPAGIGLSQRLFEIHDELLDRAIELVSGCPCADGCPSCVGPSGEDGTGGKEETLALLDRLCHPYPIN